MVESVEINSGSLIDIFLNFKIDHLLNGEAKSKTVSRKMFLALKIIIHSD